MAALATNLTTKLPKRHPKVGFQPLCRVFLQRRHHVRVRVHREADLTVPLDFHDRPSLLSLSQKQRSAGMAKIMKSDSGSFAPAISLESSSQISPIERR